MLCSLKVENFALIHQLKMDFAPGFNILTGETGAGKSILIDAVQAVLGNRTSPECIRTGADAAYIEAVFEANGGVDDLLSSWGWQPEEEGLLIMSRRITRQGKSQCTVNGHAATLSMMRQIGELLLDIHGQHDHQSLLRWEQHGAVLDLFGGNELLREKETVAQYYREWRELTKAWQGCIGNERERAQRLDLIRFQQQEIAAAKLKDGEDTLLQEEWKVLTHAEKLKTAAESAYEYLYAGRKGQVSVLDGLEQVTSRLREIAKVDKQMEQMLEVTEGLLYQLEDLSREVSSYKENLEIDPQRLQTVHARLDLLDKLKKKYGATVTEILAYNNALTAELDKLTNNEERAAILQKECAAVHARLTAAAERLSGLRKTAADRLKGGLARELTDLGMKQAIFEVAFEKNDLSAHGLDRMEFLFSANPGEAPKPLAKIISGGELSRVMLALKTALCNVDQIETVIFDEIDTGIGGEAAQAVAEKMAQIAGRRQVLCITHLPQIACMADQHFFIRKKVADGRSYTEVTVLDLQLRKAELARMLGGAQVTETIMNHAAEMLYLAEQEKKIWKK